MPRFVLDMIPATPPVAAHPVQVPEFGDGVVAYVAELTADERDRRLEGPWQKHSEANGDGSMAGFRALAVAACLCDEQRQFLAATQQDIAAAAERLGKCDSRPITRLFVKAAEINGLTGGDDDEKN